MTGAAPLAVEHPCGGQIGPIFGRESQLRHTVVHFLNTAERWDHLRGVSSAPRDKALSAGCGQALFKTDKPAIRAACQSCREHIALQYGTVYEPLYMEDLAAAAQSGRWGHWCGDARASDAFVGDQGIFVLVMTAGVSEENVRYSVCTAYRVPPRGQPEHQHSPLQFKKAALRKLQDKTDYNPHGTTAR